MLFLFLVIAVIEVFAGIPKVFQLLNDPDAAKGGDYKFDPLGFSDSKNIKELSLTTEFIEMVSPNDIRVLYAAYFRKANGWSATANDPRRTDGKDGTGQTNQGKGSTP